MDAIEIIMTECVSAFGGHYVDFKEKGTGRRVGEVDSTMGKHIIFSGLTGWLTEIGSRTRKASAIKFLQESLRARYPMPVKFRWNVMRERERI